MGEEKINLNMLSYQLVKDMIRNKEKLNLELTKLKNGGTILDTGVKARGGIRAGEILTEISMGGLGSAKFGIANFEGYLLPSITVTTDHPALSALGSQMGSFDLVSSSYGGIISGPARALALSPRKLYEDLNHLEKSKIAVAIYQADELPNEEVVEFVSEKCRVRTENIFVLATSLRSIAGVIQVLGRIIEDGIYQLYFTHSFDVARVKYVAGIVPLPPISSENSKWPKISPDDMIAYCGKLFLYIEGEEENLKKLAKMLPSASSENYGKLFNEIIEEAGYDFSKVDKKFFAPAVVQITDLKTGKIYKGGKINTNFLKRFV